VFIAPNFAEAMLFPPVPQIICIHDLIPLFYPEENPFWSHYANHLVPRLIAASIKVFAVSEHTKRDIVDHYKVDEKKILVTYNGVDQRFFLDKALPRPDELDKYFLFVGTFARRKNLDTTLRALAKIANEIPEKLAVVAHWEPARGREIQDLARDMGITERLRFFSDLSISQLIALYKHATATVLLSEYEGFGYPAAESMAAGTPVIVSDSTSLAEITGDAGLKVPCRDTEAAARAMLAVATRPELRRHLVEKGRAKAVNYTCERSMDVVNNAIRASLNGM
jgi:glycosyltransferase involved in cell wall biosynthesis